MTPPKLVAPIMRNSRNIWATGARVTAEGAADTASTEGLLAASLMTLGRGSLEAVNHTGLRHSKREPVLDIALQADIELRNQLFLLFGHILFAIEFDLEGELAYQRLMLAASPPERDVTLGDNTYTEVELTERQ